MGGERIKKHVSNGILHVKNIHFLLMKIVARAGGLSACIAWNTLQSNPFGGWWGKTFIHVRIVFTYKTNTNSTAMTLQFMLMSQKRGFKGKKTLVEEK